MKLFETQKNDCAFIGMVHLGALPGTPGSCLSIDEILQNAMRDAQNLVDVMRSSSKTWQICPISMGM